MSLRNLKIKSLLFAVFMLASVLLIETQAQGLNGEWRLTEMKINGAKTALDENNLPTLTIDSKNKAYGNSGCNRYSTDFQLKKKSLSFRPAVSTKMACISEISNLIEASYLNTLSKIQMYKISGKSLILSDKKGTNLLKFNRLSARTNN